MRTTITLDDDVAVAVEQMRKRHGIGLSDAVNRLARAGLMAPRSKGEFRQRTRPLGLRIDVTNVAEALEILEGPTAR